MGENMCKENRSIRTGRNRGRASRIRRSLIPFLGVCICAILVLSYVTGGNFGISRFPRFAKHHATAGIKALDWNLVLVNGSHPMPADYPVKCVTVRGGARVDKRIFDSLQEMFDAARADGVHPIVVSGYRTYKEQEKLLKNKIKAYEAQGFRAEEAERQAREWVAEPGTSEHQTGLALDISYDRKVDGISASAKETVQKWLSKNSYKYGFVLRYPAGKSNITGISYEPWHFRYVGKEAAHVIYESDICLEEYIGG